MGDLVTTSNFPDPDAAYVTLIDARRGMSEADAAALDARLVLILANHIGDLEVLRQGDRGLRARPDRPTGAFGE